MAGSSIQNIYTHAQFVSLSSKQWNSPEDRIALAGLRFAAIAAFWASLILLRHELKAFFVLAKVSRDVL